MSGVTLAPGMRKRLVRIRSVHGVTATVFACLLVAIAAACTPSPEPCLNAGACGEGEECLANRCVPEGGEGVPVDSLRLVCRLESATGSEILELQFDGRWQNFERIDAAFLLLEATDQANAPVRIRAKSVGGPRGGTGALAPSSEGLVAPEGRVRIDVTELVRSWQGAAGTPRTISLSTTDGSPLQVSLGTASGTAPRLEVYGR